LIGLRRTMRVARKEDFMRRWIGIVGVLLVVVIGSSVFLYAAAKKYEGQTMQIMVGITPKAAEQVREDIAPKLKDKYGIEVAVEAQGSTAILEKIILMKDNPRVTIAGWDSPVGARGAEMGLCSKIDISKIPNVKDMYEWALVKQGGDVMVLTTSVVAVGIIYNEDVFKQKGFPPPTSWNDLWKKEYAGRVSIVAPQSTWGLASLVAISRVEGGGEDNVDPGFRKLKTLLPNIHTIHTWSSELAKLMQLGEVWIAITGDNMGPALKATGFPAKWVAPKEGAPMVNGGVSIVANAPYQDVAYDYLNLYYSQDYQLRRVRESGILCAIKTVWDKLTPKEKESLSMTNKDFDKLAQLDWTKIEKNRAAWTERWQKEMK
jgi:putative spermidine/putrescine transport system substrate-binding protein